MNNRIEIFLVVSFLVLISAVWVESDAYRYVAFPMVAVSLYLYYKAAQKPSLPLIGKTYFAWVIYVIGYYLLAKFMHPQVTGGSAEGIYLLPIICPSVGYFFYLYRHLLPKFAWGFQIISVLALLVSIHPIIALSSPLSLRVKFLFHANSIHASLGAAMILIASLFFLLWILDHSHGRVRQIGILLAIANIAMSLIGIFGASSKGIWVSLFALTLIAMIYTLFFSTDKNVKLVTHAIFWSCSLITALILWSDYDGYLLKNISGGAKIITQIATSDSLSISTTADLIEHANLPKSTTDRLYLWLKAIQIWSTNPIFGRSIYWQNLWDIQTQYPTRNELVHNGYLSIGMRFGLVGLIFYGVQFFWSALQIKHCVERGLVNKLVYYLSNALLLLYLFSIVTNSNHRLAIGESFTIVFIALGFMCNYLLQMSANTAPDKKQEPVSPK